MQIISQQEKNSCQGYPVVEVRSVHRILEQMGFKMLELSPQKSTFCFPNTLCHKNSDQNIVNIKMNREWFILQFLIKFKAEHNQLAPTTKQLINKIEKLNQDQSRFLITSYNQSIDEIRSLSKKIELNLAHINLLRNIIKEFESIEKFLMADSKEENKISEKFSMVRQILEKKRSQRQKSSNNSFTPLSSSKLTASTLSQFYKDSKKKGLARYQKKQTDQPFSLRFIKLFNRNVQKFIQPPVDHPQIQIITSKYQIFNLGSVNKPTHQLIQQAINCQQQLLEEIKHIVQQEKEVIIRQSHLVSKHSTSDNYQALINQLKMLSFMRHSQCRSINSFYVNQDVNLIFRQKIAFQVFSDYQSKNLNLKISKKKNSLMILESLAEGLYFLNTKKILHRDLKPENILLTTQYQPKIIDFGSAYFSNQYKGSRLLLTKTLKTSRYYNLFYSQIPEAITAFYNRYEFETSPFFDIYALGKLIDKLFEAKETREQLGFYFYECIEWLVETCTELNPQDRAEPLDIYIYVRYLIELIVNK